MTYTFFVQNSLFFPWVPVDVYADSFESALAYAKSRFKYIKGVG